jgi:hypothetical protein
MKTVAIFLLLTFSGTILVPVAMSLTKQNQISLFIVDEEKSNNAGQQLLSDDPSFDRKRFVALIG